MRDFRAGKREALERVYREHVALVATVVRRGAVLSSTAQIGAVAGDEVHDLVQETFVRAFAERARLGYDGLRPYRPYLLTICRNLVADWARRRGREVIVEIAFEEGPPTDAEPAWADPKTVAIVERYVASLGPPLVDVYAQRYIRCASQEDAARVLGMSRQRLRTLEEKLRHGLENALRDAPK